MAEECFEKAFSLQGKVDAICPGCFLTGFDKTLSESETGRAFVKKMLPLNRVGQVEELKSQALYLAACPAYMTGSQTCIDGGRSIV
jgi:NAD(P)-dependent dehydrogenase (short-subunit alcohol dehydrogenase family)